MSNRDLRMPAEQPEPDNTPVISQFECDRRITIHGSCTLLFAAAQMAETAFNNCAAMVERLPKVRQAGEQPMEERLGVVAMAAKEFILKKLADLGLIETMDPPHAENDNGPKLVE